MKNLFLILYKLLYHPHVYSSSQQDDPEPPSACWRWRSEEVKPVLQESGEEVKPRSQERR